jgi:CelD/BcsL family acetyltransferase involved in cellulose biosynthesis
MPAAGRDSSHEVRTTVVDDAGAFARLAAEWDDLLGHSGSRVYFLRHSWNLHWWRHYAPPGSRLHIVTCRDGSGRLVGVLPTYWRQLTWLGVPYVRELVFIGMGIALKTSEYLDVMARRDFEAAVARALEQHLAGCRHWDRIWLHQVPIDSPVLPHWSADFADSLTTVPCDRAPCIDTSDSWAAFKQTLGRSMRRNVEYYPRRLQRSHTLTFRRATTAAEIDEAMSHLVRLHQARWLSRREAGAFSYPSFEQFLRDVAQDGCADGSTRLWTLSIDGTVQATLLGFLDAGVLHYFQKGFNPAFAADELGNVMLAYCVRACCDDPEVRVFDFMGGGAPYKKLWARHARETVSVEAQRNNRRTALYRAQQRLLGHTVRLLRALTPLAVREARRQYLKRRILKG